MESAECTIEAQIKRLTTRITQNNLQETEVFQAIKCEKCNIVSYLVKREGMLELDPDKYEIVVLRSKDSSQHCLKNLDNLNIEIG